MSNQIISAYVNEIIKRFDKVVEVHENRLKYLNMWLNVCQNQNKVVEIVSLKISAWMNVENCTNLLQNSPI